MCAGEICNKSNMMNENRSELMRFLLEVPKKTVEEEKTNRFITMKFDEKKEETPTPTFLEALGKLVYIEPTSNEGKEDLTAIEAPEEGAADIEKESEILESYALFHRKGTEKIENIGQLESETIYNFTVCDIMAREKNYFNENTFKRIEQGIDSVQILPYQDREGILGSYSYHNGESRIRVFGKSFDQIERTIRHETNHFLSYNEEIKGENSSHELIKACGVRRTKLFLDEERGIERISEDENRGMNEGITTMFTNAQLASLDYEKGICASRENGYKSTTELCTSMCGILGEEIVKKAYYGGNLELLRDEVNRKAGANVFEVLSKDMDKVTYSKDREERIEAMHEAQDILAEMWKGDRNG